MYIDFEDYRPQTPTLASVISRREGVLLSIIAHLAGVILLLVVPDLPFFKNAAAERAKEAELRRLEELERAREAQRFVFVQPRVDREALRPPPTPELSDKDRMAQTLERAERPTNMMPFSRGNTPERVEALPETQAQAMRPGTQAGGERAADGTRDQGESSFPLEGKLPAAAVQSPGGRASSGGSLREALQNLQKFVETEKFSNPTGGAGAFGPSIQFDTKGVEFGPWIRRFVAQIKRNWFIPYAARLLKGRVVLTFNVHKDGTITDLSVPRPSDVEAFTNAAFNALVSSNPTQPLPPEYPSPQAFFTVTFYYNEAPSPTP
jgi:TonB family protein